MGSPIARAFLRLNNGKPIKENIYHDEERIGFKVTFLFPLLPNYSQSTAQQGD
jgi:hypothetical protein